MRIVTWNCCHGRFEDMARRLDPFGADVTIVQECWRPAAGRTDCVWMGDDPKHGIAISVGRGWRISPVEALPDVPRYALPARIARVSNDFSTDGAGDLAADGSADGLGSEAEDAFVLGVWTLDDRPHRYVKAAIRAVEMYADEIRARPTIIAGDFNSNAIWNRKRDDSRDHKYLVRMLAELGLVSAYHAFRGEEHGGETTPTFHMYKRESEPFHLDYCFVPAGWTVANVAVGAYADWARDSDHRPLVVDVHAPTVADVDERRPDEALAVG